MHKSLFLIPLALLVANNGDCTGDDTDKAAVRQSQATLTSMDAADRETGFPAISNFAQRKLLKNAYEDMDQTTLTYVYLQGKSDGKLLCVGQALGYGVSLGTQFTAPHRVEYHSETGGGNVLLDQADPNMLYMPTNGAATIVDLINPANGEAHTVVMEPDVITSPFKLSAALVVSPCPSDVDPAKVKDAKETSVVGYH